VINGIHDAKQLHEEYASAEPFPHIVLDEFLKPRFADQIASELEATDIDSWHRDDHPDQVNKRWMDQPDLLPSTAGMALRYLNTPDACEFFSVLTGIPGLEPDFDYLGGGVHVTLSGGRLGVHSDFNLHPKTKMHRRVNALIFLNRDWDPAWQGQLQLWSRDLDRPVVTVNPDFNRLAVFTIRDDAFHGVPTALACPPERKRFSLALYYYTADRPDEEKAPFHWASWQQVEEQVNEP
jgi:Rps23 Pro-64 3,4-dihydroxylase Tpa1-like proline 4-hydroxylase